MMRLRSIIGLALLAGACGNDPQTEEKAGAPVAAPDTPQFPMAAERPAAPVAARSSRFSPVSGAACRIISETEETGDWVRRCPGVAPFALEWSSGDLREDLAVLSGERHALGLPALVANGAFDSLGKTVEWRGPTGNSPDVLVARVKVANDQGEDDGGHLAVARLNPRPCLVAVIRPQPGQSDQARAVADRSPLPPCLRRDQ